MSMKIPGESRSAPMARCVYIVDHYNHRIQVTDTQGVFRERWAQGERSREV